MKSRFARYPIWIFLIVLLVIIAVVSLIVLYLITTERREYPVLTQEAALDDWLGLKSLGENYSYTVHKRNPFSGDNFPPETDTVIVDRAYRTINSEEVSDQLYRWVMQGGTLIYKVEDDRESESRSKYMERGLFPSRLQVYSEQMDIFQLSEVMIQDGEFREWAEDRFREFMESSLCVGSNITVPLDDQTQLRRVENEVIPPIMDFSRSSFESSIEVYNEKALAKLNLGRGTVYFVSDLSLWNNWNIHCYDHGYLFLRLVHEVNSLEQIGPEVRQVWILPHEALTSIWTLLWINYFPTLIGLATAFLFGVILWNIRETPAVYEVPKPRRSALDYISNAANYARRRKDLGSFYTALTRLAQDSLKSLGSGRATKNSKSENHDETKMLDQYKFFNPEDNESLISSVRALQVHLRRSRPSSTMKSTQSKSE